MGWRSPAPPGSARKRAAAMSVAATARKAARRNERGSCYRAAAAPVGSSRIGRYTKAHSPLLPARSGRQRGWRRCIVTYASITKPEKSRSRRIIEAPSEGLVESRICSYRRPVSPVSFVWSFVWVGVDTHRRDRWVAKAPPSAEHHVLSKEGGLPNAI